jgi:hypothetical protein
VVIMPKTIALQPLLTDVHKVQSVLLAVTKLNHVNDHHFRPFYDSVHVDEQWFFISEKTLQVSCIPGDKVPERYAKKTKHRFNVLSWCPDLGNTRCIRLDTTLYDASNNHKGTRRVPRTG